MTSHGQVFDIQRFSLHDGPGMRTTVFLKGCPLRCRWCSNPESQAPGPEIMWYHERCLHCGRCVKVCPRGVITWNKNKPSRSFMRVSCNACGECVRVCPSGALRLVGESRSVQEILEIILRDKPFYRVSGGGVTISGGEPMLQPGFTISLLEAIQREGIFGVLETAGLCGADEILSAARLCETVMFDLKHYDPKIHRSLTGAGNERICKNLQLLVETGVPVRIRIPLVNKLTATIENIRGISLFLQQMCQGGRRADNGYTPRVELMPYHALGTGKYAALGRAYPMIARARHEKEPVDDGAVSPEWAEELKKTVMEISGLQCQVAGSSQD